MPEQLEPGISPVKHGELLVARHVPEEDKQRDHRGESCFLCLALGAAAPEAAASCAALDTAGQVESRWSIGTSPASSMNRRGIFKEDGPVSRSALCPHLKVTQHLVHGGRKCCQF